MFVAASASTARTKIPTPPANIASEGSAPPASSDTIFASMSTDLRRASAVWASKSLENRAISTMSGM